MRLFRNISDQILLEFLISIITGLDIMFNKISKVKKSTTINSGSFYQNAIRDWASLPSAIKSITDKGNFKQAVKAHLLTQISTD